MAAPIPRPAPVTMASLPLRSMTAGDFNSTNLPFEIAHGLSRSRSELYQIHAASPIAEPQTRENSAAALVASLRRDLTG